MLSVKIFANKEYRLDQIKCIYYFPYIYNKQEINIFETIRYNRCLFNKIIISDEKYNTELIDYAHHMLVAKLEDIS